MPLTSPVIRWLSRRVKLLCISVLVISSFLPPYVPKAALAPQETSIASPQFLLVEEGFIMKSASLTRQGARRAYAKGIIHTVKEGESLERLANRYSISVDTIQWVNDLQAGSAIQPGDELIVLPVDGVLHEVRRGQNLSMIAQLYEVPQEEIVAQNDLKSTYLLAGQELIIPGGRPIIGKPTVVASAEPPPVVAPPPVQTSGDVPSPEPEPEPAEPAEPVIPPSFTPEPTQGVLQKPCSANCFITQYYHARHYALDLQEKGGGPIYAAEAGTVIRSDYGWNGGYGNVIEIDHGNDLITLYAHNEELFVEVGDVIKRGQKIADMGHTGLVYGKTGIHVHFEVRVRGLKKNPLLYIQ